MSDAVSPSLFESARGCGTQPGPIRVVVIGGTALVRAAFGALISRRAGFEVVADGTTPDLVFAQLGSTDADIALVDIDDSCVDVADWLHAIHAASAGARMLVMTKVADTDLAHRALIAGASGVVLKENCGQHLLDAIRKVNDGDLWIDRATAALLVSTFANDRREHFADPDLRKIQLLTQREREVIARVSGGLSNKRIAAEMGVSDNTVRHHLTSIFAKLDVSDRVELAIYALQHKLGRSLVATAR